MQMRLHLILMISIHAPTRGATRRVRRPTGWSGLFQFTPLREGRRKAFRSSRLISQISIHAPTRGATPAGGPVYALALISIHAPTRGATRLFLSDLRSGSFQFTPLREGRPTPDPCHNRYKKFQFTPLREGRHSSWLHYNTTINYFNSRPYARGDTDRRWWLWIQSYFNSRPYARGDAVSAD